MLRRMVATRKIFKPSSRIGGPKHLRPFQQMSHDRERAECGQDESIWKAKPDSLRDCRLIDQVSYLDHVCTLGQHSIREKTASKDEPYTGHQSLPQSDQACGQWCCQRKNDREDFWGAVICANCEHTSCAGETAKQAAKDS